MLSAQLSNNVWKFNDVYTCGGLFSAATSLALVILYRAQSRDHESTLVTSYVAHFLPSIIIYEVTVKYSVFLVFGCISVQMHALIVINPTKLASLSA